MYCRPMKMQANSAANSAPASRPPGSVPSRANSGDAARPRPQPDQERRAERAQRRLPERPESPAAPPWRRPGSGPRGSSRRRGATATARRVECGALRSVIVDDAQGCSCPLRSPPSESEGGLWSAIAGAQTQSLDEQRRQQAGDEPLACANGAMAMSQPAAWRSAGPQGASLSDLDRQRAERGAAPIARRGPRACSDQVQRRRTRRRHAARPTGRRSGAGRVAASRPTCVSGQASEPGDGDRRAARARPSRARRRAARRPGWRRRCSVL